MAVSFFEERIRGFNQAWGGLIRIVPGHNVGELVWMNWMAKSNVLDLKNNLKIKGTFRRLFNSES